MFFLKKILKNKKNPDRPLLNQTGTFPLVSLLQANIEPMQNLGSSRVCYGDTWKEKLVTIISLKSKLANIEGINLV